MRTGVSGTTDGVVITINQRVAHLIPAPGGLIHGATKRVSLLATSSRLPV